MKKMSEKADRKSMHLPLKTRKADKAGIGISEERITAQS
jgi:hypothetical protein